MGRYLTNVSGWRGCYDFALMTWHLRGPGRSAAGSVLKAAGF